MNQKILYEQSEEYIFFGLLMFHIGVVCSHGIGRCIDTEITLWPERSLEPRLPRKAIS